MEITTQPRWSGIVWRSDPNDPSTWLSSVTLDVKIVCASQIVYIVVYMHVCMFACQRISISIFLHARLVLFTSSEVSEISLQCFGMKACALFTCSLLKHVHSVHCLCCIYSTVFVFVCRTEQKLFSELAGVVRSVSVWLLPKAKEPSCRRRGSSCSPTTISG